MAADVGYARNVEPFSVFAEGFPRVIRRGDIVGVDDPVYVGREHLFEPVEEHAEREVSRRKGVGSLPTVERMTAGPGERRRVSIPESSGDDGDDGRVKASPGYVCDHDGCGFASTSERGLKIHQRTHAED